MSRQELRIDLEQYDFVAPTGVPLAPFLDFLMKETLEPQDVAGTCEDIEAMRFQCHGGPLRNVAPWIELRRRVRARGAWN